LAFSSPADYFRCFHYLIFAITTISDIFRLRHFALSSQPIRQPFTPFSLRQATDFLSFHDSQLRHFRPLSILFIDRLITPIITD